METAAFIICAGAFIWWGELALEWWLASRAGVDLADMPEPSSEIALSVIVPARDEGKNIEKALGSLLHALPGNGEVILVNDRSTDDTGLIAHRLGRSSARLRVIDIADIPAGWLGKNHAMQAGYKASKGEYLLFTDADVVFMPGCLDRALGLCASQGVDHLVATPFMITRGFWEKVFVCFFSILLVSRFRIWRAALPRSRFYAGIGAFNMVSRKIYEMAGTHEAIKGEVVDDLYLGRLIKRAGGRQLVVSGERCLQVRWNEGVGGLVRGLEKNAFAGFDYKLLLMALGCVAVLLLTVFPAALPFVCLAYPGAGIGVPVLMASLGVWFSFILLYQLAAPGAGANWLYFLTFPLGSILLLWTIVRSTVLYYVRGGVKWRGTVYRNPGSPSTGSGP